MAQLLKQLKIKTSMLKRLRKQYDSYDQQTNTIQHKLTLLEQTPEQHQDIQHNIKKHQQFLVESQTVLSNVKQKLIQAFEGLTQFLSEKGEDEAIAALPEKEAAENMVLEVETFLENLE